MSRKTGVRNTITIAFILGISILLIGCQHNRAPVADAGNKSIIYMEEIVYLNGSMSHDPDGDQLEYQWIFSIVPDGSSPFLDDASSAYASFRPDMPGTYILELRVFDGELYSGRDHVLIKVNSDLSTISPPSFSTPTPPIHIHPPTLPVAPPMGIPDYFTVLGKEIFIQGSVNDPSVIIEWNILKQPNDSSVTLDRNNPGGVNFSTNKLGNYVIQEIVSHSGHEISNDQIQIQVVEKIVNAGPDRFVGSESIISLSFAYFSPTPPPADTIIQWEIVNMPELSNAKLVDAKQYNTAFIPDIDGIYEISVLVDDPDGEQMEDTITITVSEEFMREVDHNLVSGACVDCHNSIIASGRTTTHIDTSDSCASCHSTSTWTPIIAVDHSEISSPSTCINCHNNIIAIGKNTSHVTSSDSCVTCHSTNTFIPAIAIDHTQVIGSCESCHNNVISSGINPTHISTTNTCEACHSNISFIPIIVVDHKETIGTCDSCHNSIIAMGKNASHISSSITCNVCHSVFSWTPTLPKNNALVMPDGLDISIENNSSTYQMGELITVTAIFTNNSTVDIELITFAANASPLQIELAGMNLNTLVLSNPNDLPFSSTEEGISVLKTGESITREVAWDQIRFDSNGLTPKGNYTLEAFVLALEPGTIKRQSIGIKSDIVIEHPANLIDINTAVLTALDDTAVQIWYETLDKNITCRLNDQVTQINDYEITPIQTLIEVPKSDIQCHALLVNAKKPMWDVYFQNPNVTGNFSYHVSIDAVSSELIMSMSM